MEHPSEQTLVSDPGDESEVPDEQLVIVCVGSPEHGFEHAGATIGLHGIHRVRFGRTQGDDYEHRVEDGVLEIGIPLPWVSGQHAELHLTGPRLRIVDQGSRNGTFVEGHPVETRADLGLGRVFEVGRSFWMLRRVRRPIEGEVEALTEPRPFNPEMRQLSRAIARLAPSAVPILIVGETGTGKERLARTIHARSGRTGPFEVVSVAAGSIERALFGQGDRLLAAAEGTLLLDDVGELTPGEQTELTSVLMSRMPGTWHLERTSVGEPRLLASSARDLRVMVETGVFRPDLMSCLAGYEARLPPLRARREDLGPLAYAVLQRAAGDRAVPRLSTEVFRAMLAHPWPFNLRELDHSLTAALGMLEDDAEEIDTAVWSQACWTVEGGDPTPTRIEAVRQELVLQLSRHRGELQAVAAALQCSVEDVERWAQRLSLRPDRYRDAV